MKTVEKLPLLRVSPGTDRHLALYRYGKPGARPKAYFQASLHANELPAMLAAQHLIEQLDEAEREGRILGEILVTPVANPIGLSQFVGETHLGRYELGSGQNFNRGFEDRAAAAAQRLAGRLGPDAAANVALIRQALADAIAEVAPRSELESLRRLLLLNAIDADYVFDMHSADDALMHIYFGAARWPDGADLSAETGSRATLLAADSGGDPFDEVFGNIWAKLRRALGDAHPIPDACMSATLEYRGHADVADELATGDAAALIRFLQRRGLIAGDPGPLPEPLCEATELAAADTPRAPVGGVVVYKTPLGASLSAGQVVAEILDPLAEDPARRRVPVCTCTDGLLYQRKRTRLVRPGQVICRIAGRKRLAEEGATMLEP